MKIVPVRILETIRSVLFCSVMSFFSEMHYMYWMEYWVRIVRKLRTTDDGYFWLFFLTLSVLQSTFWYYYQFPIILHLSNFSAIEKMCFWSQLWRIVLDTWLLYIDYANKTPDIKTGLIKTTPMRENWVGLVLTDQKINGSRFRCTASFGISHFPKDATNDQSLIESADKALYRSKGEGRNRVTIA